TNEAFYFEGGDFPKVLGKRPKSAGDGPFVGRIPLLVCKRPINEEEALKFFQAGKTELLTNFISKRDRPFNAMLYVKANGKYGFEFEPRKKKEPAEKKEGTEETKTATKKKAAPKKAAVKKPAAKKTTAKKSVKKDK
ncbi:topoisomerase C-terminal repeat-containing protein, partial [bacterium]|nr:topoisomerase C-terminal repeat-containing protein [bacterium]